MAGTRTGVTVLYNRLPEYAASLGLKVEAVVAKTALDVQAQAQSRAPVDTGFLKASIQASKVGDAHWRVSVGADYGIYQEYGTAHAPAHPFMQPAVDVVGPVFLSALRAVLGRL